MLCYNPTSTVPDWVVNYYNHISFNLEFKTRYFLTIIESLMPLDHCHSLLTFIQLLAPCSIWDHTGSRTHGCLHPPLLDRVFGSHSMKLPFTHTLKSLLRHDRPPHVHIALHCMFSLPSHSQVRHSWTPHVCTMPYLIYILPRDSQLTTPLSSFSWVLGSISPSTVIKDRTQRGHSLNY